jgi:hypothetical protein
MRKPFFVSGPHNLLFVAGIVGCLICLRGVFLQLTYEYDFKVLAIGLKCQQPLNNRCVYEFSVMLKDGSVDEIQLEGYMFRHEEVAVGNTIKKGKFSFGYQVNGKRMNWAFAVNYLWVFLFSLSALGLWRNVTPTKTGEGHLGP